MNYTPEILKNYFLMTKDLDSIALEIINKLKEKNPEVLTAGRSTVYDGCSVINTNDIVIRYFNPFEDFKILKEIYVPFDVWCIGKENVYDFIVDSWYKINPRPVIDESITTFWKYIETIPIMSNKWRKAIDLAAEYDRKNMNPSDHLKEIISIVENEN